MNCLLSCSRVVVPGLYLILVLSLHPAAALVHPPAAAVVVQHAHGRVKIDVGWVAGLHGWKQLHSTQQLVAHLQRHKKKTQEHATLDVRERGMVKQKAVAAMQALQTAVTSQCLEEECYVVCSLKLNTVCTACALLTHTAA